MAETVGEFKRRLGLNNIVNIADCSRYWEVMMKQSTDISSDDFTRLDINKVVECGTNKCVYIPKK
jgi:hypothetical protein